MMQTCPDELADAAELLHDPELWIVLIDLSFGGLYGHPEWEENSDPQPLPGALDEAAEARRDGWVCKIEPRPS